MSIEYSIIVPVLNEAGNLPELISRIEKVFTTLGKTKSFELLFVDDGSTDETLTVIQEAVKHRPYIRWIALRRNFGKSLALMAGFRHAHGQIVITMDGDLQDNPEDIPQLLAGLDKGYDLVSGWRINRQDTLIRRFGSRIFNWAVAASTGFRLHDLNCGFKAYKRELVATLCIYGQYHRYIPLQAHIDGFRVGETPVKSSPRKFGSSKYKAFRYQGLFDLLSMLFIHRFGLNPLHFFGVVSLAMIIPSAFILFYLVTQQISYWLALGGAPVYNRPLLALSLTALLIGVVIFLTGFVCDFVLHHLIRKRIDQIVETSIVDRSDREDRSAGSRARTVTRKSDE